MYKVGDVIVFVSKEPILHLNRMFGYQDATVDAFSEYELTGVIMWICWMMNSMLVLYAH